MASLIHVATDCSLHAGRLGVCAWVAQTGEQRFCYSTALSTGVLELEAILFALECIDREHLVIYTDAHGYFKSKPKRNTQMKGLVEEIERRLKKHKSVIRSKNHNKDMHAKAHKFAYSAGKEALRPEEVGLCRTLAEAKKKAELVWENKWRDWRSEYDYVI